MYWDRLVIICIHIVQQLEMSFIQVPKNVDLPITITDPNISQTVAHQPTLMELSLPIPDNSSSQDINSPSFPYALTTIEESVGLSQKSFNGSMPLLTEDVIEVSFFYIFCCLRMLKIH